VSYDTDNVFAKILRGDLPSIKIFEDADTLAFMDIMPSVEGHTLVIPKEPAETLFELSNHAALALMLTTKRVAAAVKGALACHGVMLVQLNGTAAGQSVPHLHMHIVPRFEGLDLKLHGRTVADPAQLEGIAARIRLRI
jgi:histidine triad (HIT) family protein